MVSSMKLSIAMHSAKEEDNSLLVETVSVLEPCLLNNVSL